MYLTNEGPGTVAVYDDPAAQGTPELNIAPGQLIGQVVDIVQGTDYVYYFTSDAITAASGLFTKIGNWILGFIPGKPVVNVGAVRFADINANVSQAQIDKQNSILANAANNGATFQNSIKEAAKETGEVVSGITGGLWPWLLLGGGLWLVSKSSYNSKKGFTVN